MNTKQTRFARPRRRIEAFHCRAGHLFLYRHGTCPTCGLPLSGMAISASAVLAAHTTVRVGPSGAPIRLGIARTRCGAATLCIIEGSIRGNGRERVMLVKVDNLFYALGTGNRLSAIRRRFPNPRCC